MQKVSDPRKAWAKVLEMKKTRHDNGVRELNSSRFMFEYTVAHMFAHNTLQEMNLDS